MCVCCLWFFFVKQKTAYDMRISDWSSDVCSSDLHPGHDDYQSDRPRAARTERRPPGAGGVPLGASCCLNGRSTGGNPRRTAREQRGSSGVLDGSGGGTRTPDTRIMIPLL